MNDVELFRDQLVCEEDTIAYLAKNETAYLSVIEQFIENVPSIVALEKYLSDYEQIEIQTEHIFAGGIYIRQITIPKDAFLIGKRHRYATCDVMLSGCMTLYNGYKSKPITVEAPMITESPAYKKKMGYAYAETVWLNAFPTNSNDIEAIERDIFITEEAFEDYEDFKSIIKLYGFTEEIVANQSKTKDDLIEFDKKYSVEISASDRHGFGLFASKKIKNGEFICPARVGSKRTPAGRYANHSMKPNSIMIVEGDKINIYALSFIEKETEITVDYRSSMEIIGEKPCQG